MWKKELSRQIERSNRDEWESLAVDLPWINSGDTVVGVPSRSFPVQVESIYWNRIMCLIGRINDREFCLIPARCMMIAGIHGGGDDPLTVSFVVRSVPWDRTYDPESSEFREIIDSAGRSIFETADFDAEILD